MVNGSFKRLRESSSIVSSRKGPLPPSVAQSPDIVSVLDSRQEGSDLIQLSVALIIDPGSAINGVFWMEHIRSWRVINDDGLGKVTIQQAEILDVVSFVVDTGFAE